MSKQTYKMTNKSLKSQGYSIDEYQTIVSKEEMESIQGNLTMSSNFFFTEIPIIDAPAIALVKRESKPETV